MHLVVAGHGRLAFPGCPWLVYVLLLLARLLQYSRYILQIGFQFVLFATSVPIHLMSAYWVGLFLKEMSWTCRGSSWVTTDWVWCNYTVVVRVKRLTNARKLWRCLHLSAINMNAANFVYASTIWLICQTVIILNYRLSCMSLNYWLYIFIAIKVLDCAV